MRQSQSSRSTIIDITDPLPVPPDVDPRMGMLPGDHQYVVTAGEYIRFYVDIRVGVKIVYPSGWEEELEWDVFEARLTAPPFSLMEFRERRELTSHLANYRRVVYWPVESLERGRSIDRIIMRDPEKPGFYDEKTCQVIAEGEIFA